MRYPNRHKQETHRRIVEEAARQFRERGLDAVRVADVMEAAGLTHGGFYAHFASKEALIAEAIRGAKGQGVASLRRQPEQAPRHEVLRELVERYLSARHRDRPAQGCVVAALGSEAGRHSPEARRELAARSRDLARAFLPHLPAWGPRAKADQATALAASLVGGMILARLEDDPAESERILAACRRFVLDALDGAASLPADA